MKDLIKGIKDANVSIIKDPFNVQSIEKIHLSMRRNIFNRDDIRFECDVYFVNGATSGKQELTGTSFEDLFIKLKHFVSTINP